MSNDDVREAFNICVSGGENPDCDTCPYKDIYDYRECFIVLRRHALELINRQKAEIEDLYKTLDDKIIELKTANTEIERFQKANEINISTIATLHEKIKILDDIQRKTKAALPRYEKSIKAEAIKEFAERLKECCYHNDDLSNDDCLSITSDINCILKEMVGDNDKIKR